MCGGGLSPRGGGKIFGVDGRAGGRVRGETDVNAHQSKRRINLDSRAGISQQVPQYLSVTGTAIRKFRASSSLEVSKRIAGYIDYRYNPV